jgi:aldehyde dehydrogenase (NAD+)
MNDTIQDFDCFIDGKWAPSVSGEKIDVLDPADRSVIARIARGNADDIDRAVQAARKAGKAWATCPPVQRSRVLYAISQKILREKDELAELESRDTGKPLRQAMADAIAAARFFEYYAGIADKVLGTSIPMGSEFVDFTVREPLGVAGQIVPWNYPLQIASRGLAPALATGNTIVLKPAELACLSVLKIARICHEEGLPPGVLNVVTGLGTEAGVALAGHPEINLLVFTGSVATGTAVMKAAAENIVPVLLELGGKSPNIVLPDARLTEAVPAIIRAAFPNSGQTCSAGSRVLVHRKIQDEFLNGISAALSKLTVGRGIDDPDIGPLISANQQRKVADYIEIGRQEGADFVSGGSAIGSVDLERGNFVMPTILHNASPSMRVHREEIFGPVLTVVGFDTLEEAAELANSTSYGLVAGVWGENVSQTHWLAQNVEAGQVFINCYGAGGGVELPFGGYKKSGFGREKGIDALHSYTQVKNVCIRVLPASL